MRYEATSRGTAVLPQLPTRRTEANLTNSAPKRRPQGTVFLSSKQHHRLVSQPLATKRNVHVPRLPLRPRIANAVAPTPDSAGAFNPAVRSPVEGSPARPAHASTEVFCCLFSFELRDA